MRIIAISLYDAMRFEFTHHAPALTPHLPQPSEVELIASTLVESEFATDAFDTEIDWDTETDNDTSSEAGTDYESDIEGEVFRAFITLPSLPPVPQTMEELLVAAGRLLEMSAAALREALAGPARARAFIPGNDHYVQPPPVVMPPKYEPMDQTAATAYLDQRLAALSRLVSYGEAYRQRLLGGGCWQSPPTLDDYASRQRRRDLEALRAQNMASYREVIAVVEAFKLAHPEMFPKKEPSQIKGKF